MEYLIMPNSDENTMGCFNCTCFLGDVVVCFPNVPIEPCYKNCVNQPICPSGPGYSPQAIE
jgi:hypothetical protein